jgi:arylsulfatase A-like enzyme
MPTTSHQPNIILILIDDLGRQDIGFHGSTFYETPNLDQLARESMVFTDAYAACPVCSPTRASIMSGQYPARIGVTNYIGSNQDHPSKGRLIDAPYIDHLPLTVKSLAASLSEGGYQTWHIGKWHLGDESYYPEQHGFDINIAGCHFGHPPAGYFSPYHIPTLEDGPDGEYLTDRLTDEAIALINNRETDRPFFLNLCYYSVHAPIQAPQEYVEYFQQKAHSMGLDLLNPFIAGEHFPCDHKNNRRILRRVLQTDPQYAAMIYALDANIGRLLQSIKQQELDENTVVIFTSDNGGLATSEGSPTSNLPFSEGKGWMYEGGTREPLFIRWANTIEPSTFCSTPVSSPDFYPTLLDLAQVPLPSNQVFDGLSLKPLLLGGNSLERDGIFWHYPHYGNQGGTPSAAVRKDDWKLIRFFEDGREELYHVASDPGERRDVASKELAMRILLSASLSTWLSEIGALIPESNPDHTPSNHPLDHRMAIPLSHYDLETPFGILLYNLDIRGLLQKHIDVDKLLSDWRYKGNIDLPAGQFLTILGLNAHEIYEELNQIPTRRHPDRG